MTGLPRALAPLRHPQLPPARGVAGALAAGPGCGRSRSSGRSSPWAAARRRCRSSPRCRAGGMLASTLLGGALADRIPQRRILLAVALIQARRRWPSSPRCPSTGVARSCGTSPRSRWSAGWRWGCTTRRTRRWSPRCVPAGDLLAANGLEGMVRPMLRAGRRARRPRASWWPRSRPARRWPPPPLASLLAAACLWALPTTPVRREPAADGDAAAGLLADVREGFVYMVRRRGCWPRCCSRR